MNTSRRKEFKTIYFNPGWDSKDSEKRNVKNLRVENSTNMLHPPRTNYFHEKKRAMGAKTFIFW